MNSFVKVVFLSFILKASLFSLPQVLEVHGQAVMKKNDNKLDVITQSEKTIIDWRSFNILANEVASFVQPNNVSILLNKVIGEEPSNILGKLSSNGCFLLINENVIIFGKDSFLYVETFFASTLSLKNSDFKDEMIFESNQKSKLINSGQINSNKNIYLISHQIENSVTIIAKHGQANLLAAAKVVIKPDANTNIFIQPSNQEVFKEEIGINSSGQIQAAKVNLFSDGNLYETAINHIASIKAYDVMQKSAEVYLVAKNGKIITKQNSKISAQNLDGSGGNISIAAKEISLLYNSVLDVSAEKGCGEINIEAKRSCESFPSPENINIERNVKILANADEKGNGGKVTVYSDDKADFQGQIYAKGGQYSGDGGYVEVSAKGQLQYDGIVNTQATKGKLGTLFIDPTDIFIGRLKTQNGYFDGNEPVDSFIPTADVSYVNRDSLYNALDSNDVVINTASSFESEGGIYSSSTFEYIAQNSNSGNLTLIANKDMIFSSLFKHIAFGGNDVTLSLTAGNQFSIQYTMILENLNLNVTANDILVKSGIQILESGNVNFNATRDITFDTIGDSVISFQPLRNLQLNAGNNISINANMKFQDVPGMNLSANTIYFTK